MGTPRSTIVAFALAAFVHSGAADAGPRAARGKARRPAQRVVDVSETAGKRVLEIAPIRDVRIEMPDQSMHDFGDEFRSALEVALDASGRYIITNPEGGGADVATTRNGPQDYHWNATSVPSAQVAITVEALGFETGWRGNRVFYGFDERFRTPFNDGLGTRANEFPLRSVSFEPNWFDRTFDREGHAPFDSRAGLDLGEGFRLEAILAYLHAQYARYLSTLNLRLDIQVLPDAPQFGRHEVKRVQVRGKGFFFDIVGGYQGYSAGIRVARRDAMGRAMQNALAGSAATVDASLSGLPLAARVDAIVPRSELEPEPLVLMGTGPDAGVAAGARYHAVGRTDVVVEVLRSVHDGAIGHLVAGSLADVPLGTILVQAGAGQARARSAAARDEAPRIVDLPSLKLPRADLNDLTPQVSFLKKFWGGLTGTAFIAYRVWRYFCYDQPYHRLADGTQVQVGDDEGTRAVDPGRDPMADDDEEDAGRDLPTRTTGTLVAVIDSGVDYNHPAIHDALWKNAVAQADPRGRRDDYGWDFVSNDPQPFDDHYHGTWIASSVLSIAPAARVMPLKVFNPWGITTSAAIYAAFKYAVDHGAQIIVCGWATRLASQAIEQGVAYARERGVLVVAAAGDRGDNLAEIPAYPAALSARYDNVLTVTGVDKDDKLVEVKGRFASFDPQTVGLATRGYKIKVAEPRLHDAKETSTGIAAARVAGAVARDLMSGRARGGYRQWIEDVRAQAEVVPGLEGAVAGGRRLKLE